MSARGNAGASAPATDSKRPGRAGFTFIEVLACLLVLSLGVTAAVGMVMYGVLVANRAQAKATGMATALSIAVDPKPLLPDGAPWESSASESKGWVNGFYVTRSEKKIDAPADGFTTVSVSVDVYDGFKGRLVASYTTPELRQDAP